MSGSETAFVIAVVSEAESDQRMARGLAERILVEEIEWLENAAELCLWRGFAAGASHLPWSEIERQAKQPGLVIHGR